MSSKLRVIEKAFAAVAFGFVLTLGASVTLSILAVGLYMLIGENFASAMGVSIWLLYLSAYFCIMPFGIIGGFITGLIYGIQHPDAKKVSDGFARLLDVSLIVIVVYIVLCVVFVLTR